MAVVRILCEEMVSSRKRTVPAERLDDVSPAYLEHLAAAGVVALDGRRCGFGHESLLDYCAARVFFNRRESLVSSLEGSSQHLSHRTRIRQTLAYLRDADPSQYARELRGLLAGERVRPHVKDLAFATLADVPESDGREWAVWGKWISHRSSGPTRRRQRNRTRCRRSRMAASLHRRRGSVHRSARPTAGMAGLGTRPSWPAPARGYLGPAPSPRSRSGRRPAGALCRLSRRA